MTFSWEKMKEPGGQSRSSRLFLFGQFRLALQTIPGLPFG